MKNRYVIKLSALLLSVLYFVAITGFDVHSCSDDGHVYVGFLVNGISCANLHPGTPCHHHGSCSCCECGEGGCEEGEDCCYDDIQRITLTGSGDDVTQLQASPALFFMAVINTPVPSASAGIATPSVDGVLRSPPPPDLSLLCMLKA